jgi:hypothetical protein
MILSVVDENRPGRAFSELGIPARAAAALGGPPAFPVH